MTSSPGPASAYRVFAQSSSVALELATWSGQARRFFGTGLAAGARPGGVRVLPGASDRGDAPSERCVTAALRTDADLALADEAELRAGGGGLAQLARRCPVVWTVERQGEADALALRLAAILASVLLGPIVDPTGPSIFGVKTARAKLDGL